MRYVNLTTAEDSYQAHFIRKALEDVGIQCIIVNEHTSNLLPLAGPIGDLIQIRVVEADHETAVNVLSKLRADTDSVKCPNCGSTNVKYGMGIKHRFRRVFVLVMAVLFWTPVAKFHLVYHCEECNTEFRKSKF